MTYTTEVFFYGHQKNNYVPRDRVPMDSFLGPIFINICLIFKSFQEILETIKLSNISSNDYKFKESVENDFVLRILSEDRAACLDVTTCSQRRQVTLKF